MNLSGDYWHHTIHLNGHEQLNRELELRRQVLEQAEQRGAERAAARDAARAERRAAAGPSTAGPLVRLLRRLGVPTRSGAQATP